ncbi:MAG: protein-glutamate methyltransferase [Methylobacterium sp.]|uniref:CheR family methyltransferase n=1 Tax=Methylobacterium sp. TaxID=409 RepID=UPI0025FE6CE6|nr:CheR family methyltransferase [Methylobacterium sp.]MBX9930597.1 protein-glutamate methyltransferase [Methylobacterium sp.]
MMRPIRPGPGEDPDYPALKALVIARTGHHYYLDKDSLLFDRLHRRFKACGLADSGGYLARLKDREAGPPEWAALESEITIGETFFFRYAEQFAALRETILPGLIAARSKDRTLRIWSAGCSTGAEPYSIAVLLYDLLGAELTSWNISITGTDIDAAALEVGRSGEYGRWALRTMLPDERQRLFVAGPPAPGAAREGSFTLRQQFRRMVRFELQNLLALLDGGLPRFSDFDLILCRNVLIYFDAETVLSLVRSFGWRLKLDGWLLLGHAEPNPSFADVLDPVTLPGTVAYRPRGAIPIRAPRPEWRPLPMPELDLEPEMKPEFEPAHRPPLAPPPAVFAIAEGPQATSSLDRIRMLSDAGETAEAWREVRVAIDDDPTLAPLHYYDGLLAWSLGRDAEAERALRGALYLDRDFVMAHYQLGLLMISTGRAAEALRILDNAVRIASLLPPQEALPEGDGTRAGDLAVGAALARDALLDKVS